MMVAKLFQASIFDTDSSLQQLNRMIELLESDAHCN